MFYEVLGCEFFVENDLVVIFSTDTFSWGCFLTDVLFIPGIDCFWPFIFVCLLLCLVKIGGTLGQQIIKKWGNSLLEMIRMMIFKFPREQIGIFGF